MNAKHLQNKVMLDNRLFPGPIFKTDYFNKPFTSNLKNTGHFIQHVKPSFPFSVCSGNLWNEKHIWKSNFASLSRAEPPLIPCDWVEWKLFYVPKMSPLPITEEAVLDPLVPVQSVDFSYFPLSPVQRALLKDDN